MAELRTFVFTDISGSVRLKNEMAGRSVTERDLAFIQSVLTPHRERIEARLAEYGGRVVSTAGDGHFLVFDHTVQAAQWAISVQESHRDSPIVTPSGERVEVRMSMHVGVPQIDPADSDNFVGKTVDYAARLNDYATGGQILVSRSVMAILDDVSLEGVRLHMHGRRTLKGIGSVEIHELLYDDRGPRDMRNQPKAVERQWTVIPTQGFETSGRTGLATIAGGTALRRVGNYELEELIGSGGMGDVYKARHLQFGRTRAVKVIKQQFVSSDHNEVIRRFYNEIKAVGRLEHKNIVVAIDSSAPTDRVHYLVMEYIDGVSLDTLVARHGLRGRSRRLHRDVKPSNLMVTLVDPDQISGDSTLTERGEGPRAVVKILDLGLALLAEDGHDRLTRFENKAMGTGMYMSPEQWKTTSVDIRADIYSLGCTLYHLLAGNPPFFDSDLRPEKAHEKSAVPPIRSSMQPLPKKLWDVLRRMLEKWPEDRYATPAEVAAALAPFAEGHALAALTRSHAAGDTARGSQAPTQPGGISKADTWRSKPRRTSAALARHRQWLLSRAAPLALVLGFSLGVWWLLSQGVQQERERSARATLPAIALTAARGELAKEIDARFATLTKLAADENLIAALKADDRQALDKWIASLTHATGVNVDSWFVTNAAGEQVARSPVGDSIGENFRGRDYFHGLGRELTAPAEIESARPIERPHLSAVYQSFTTKKFKVAFSVPIFDAPAPQTGEPAASNAAAVEDAAKVLGVLAMSVNLADFEVLDSSQSGGNEVVLIDLRPDELDGQLKAGLILHHPRQNKGQVKRIGDDLLAKILAAQPFSRQFNSEQSFLSGYADPFDPATPYWGAFQPIHMGALASQADAAGDASQRGWIVLVQRPMYQ
ncbi:MAG: hypothetical protein DCC67_16495 [Planctomycetota bacterium]|nr:MAG: hypothetical protein DCC67_16495 [Planctomycetota bacterium]